MLPPGPGPAAELARMRHDRLNRRDGRPYPPLPETATPAEVALAATRALVHAQDRVEVREVVVTLVRDLGGALVPARFEPAAILELDVSLGVGEPVLVVAEPLSMPALHLREVLPGLLDDAHAVLRHLPDPALPRLDDEDVVTAEALPRYLALLARADGPGARALVGALLADGLPAEHLVEHLLAPAQREVGERWYRGEWSIADEHAATAITERCLATLLSPGVGADELPLVVLASPEGEWHGPHGSRAAPLGADAWTGSATELADLLPELTVRSGAPALPREALLAEAVPIPLLQGVLAQQGGIPWVARMNEVQRRSAVDEMRWISRHAAAAYVVADQTVLDEPLRWLAARLRHGNAPDALLADVTSDLAEAMAVETPAVAALVADAAERLRADPVG